MAKSIEEARRMWLNGLETQSKPKVKLTPEAVDLLESRWEMTEHGTHLVDELISFIVLPGDYDNNMDVERYWELYL